jgi:hypothetical protein
LAELAAAEQLIPSLPIDVLGSPEFWQQRQGKTKELMALLVQSGTSIFHYLMKLAPPPEGFVKVGLNSFANFQRNLFVHVWESSEAASAFSQLYKRLWKVICEFRFEEFRVPLSAMFSSRGYYISCSVIPTFEPNRGPITLRGKQTTDELLGHRYTLFREALGLPQLASNDRPVAESPELLFFQSESQHLYIASLANLSIGGAFDVISNRVPPGTGVGKLDTVQDRHLLTRTELLYSAYRHFSSCSHSPRSTPSLHRSPLPLNDQLICNIVIPRVVRRLLEPGLQLDGLLARQNELVVQSPLFSPSKARSTSLSSFSTEPSSPSIHGSTLLELGSPRRSQQSNLPSLSALVKEKALTTALHRNGVNLSRLNVVREVLKSAKSNAVGRNERLLAERMIKACAVEMFGRTLKALIRAEFLEIQQTTSVDGVEDFTANQILAWNTYTTIFLGRSAPFFVTFLLPALRAKYHAPGFELSALTELDQSDLLLAFDVASRKFGCQFDESTGEFSGFADACDVVPICALRPTVLSEKKPKPAREQLVAEAWDEVLLNGDVTDPRNQALARRAILGTVLADTCFKACLSYHSALSAAIQHPELQHRKSALLGKCTLTDLIAEVLSRAPDTPSIVPYHGGQQRLLLFEQEEKRRREILLAVESFFEKLESFAEGGGVKPLFSHRSNLQSLQLFLGSLTLDGDHEDDNDDPIAEGSFGCSMSPASQVGSLLAAPLSSSSSATASLPLPPLLLSPKHVEDGQTSQFARNEPFRL